MNGNMEKPAPCICGSVSWSRHIVDGDRFVCASCHRPLWRPIETAPKDDTDVLILCGDGDIVIGSFAGGMWWIEQTYYEKRKPTYWMPLLEPPKS